MARTVTPNGQKIQELRIAKGWSQEELANESRCSVRTIINLEKGRPVFLKTLRLFAQSFNVDFQSLLTDTAPPEPTNPPDIKIPLRLNELFSQFDQSDQLVGLIDAIDAMLLSFSESECLSSESECLSVEQDQENTDARKGKTIICLAIHSDRLKDFINAFIDLRLATLNITAMKLPTGRPREPIHACGGGSSDRSNRGIPALDWRRSDDDGDSTEWEWIESGDRALKEWKRGDLRLYAADGKVIRFFPDFRW